MKNNFQNKNMNKIVGCRRFLSDPKGITLISLVIIIILLIILAGVAISLSLGENGIFRKAQFGAQSYANAQESDATAISNISNQINSMSTIVGSSNRDYEPVIYKSQTFNQTTATRINGDIPELSLTLEPGTYLVGFEGYVDHTNSNANNAALYLPIWCSNTNINKCLGTGIIVELKEKETLTFWAGTNNPTRFYNVCTYAIKLK